MPFSIVTKDGITINNIPDDIDPNSDVLKARVAEIRQQRAGGQDVTRTDVDRVGDRVAVGQPALVDDREGAGLVRPRTEGVQGAVQADAINPIVEAGLTLGTGALAEIAAGIAGITQAINPLAEPGAGARAVEATREALTFQPRQQAGREALQTVAGAIEPVAKAFTAAEDFLGDKTFEITGSPTLAAAAKSFPTLATELLGIAAAKTVTKSAQRAGVKGALSEAIPNVDQLKDASRLVFNELDELGATVKPEALQSINTRIQAVAKRMGVDPDVTPKAAAAIRRFDQAAESGAELTLTELDNLRTIAQNAASAIEGGDRAIGTAIINEIDTFLDRAGTDVLKKTQGVNIGKRYQAARKLWGRARRAETISEAFEKANLQASGFENGIRVQFRQILNNKRKSRFFTAGELKSMRDVVKGTGGQNLAKLIGRLAPGEGGATNILGAGLGVGIGASIAGAPGALTVLGAGIFSRSLAARLTAKGAKFTDELVRAGSNANQIVRAYINNTPKSQRNPVELSELLTRGDIDLSQVKGALALEAADIAQQNRIALAAVAVQTPQQQ